MEHKGDTKEGCFKRKLGTQKKRWHQPMGGKTPLTGSSSFHYAKGNSGSTRGDSTSRKGNVDSATTSCKKKKTQKGPLFTTLTHRHRETQGKSQYKKENPVPKTSDLRTAGAEIFGPQGRKGSKSGRRLFRGSKLKREDWVVSQKKEWVATGREGPKSAREGCVNSTMHD